MRRGRKWFLGFVTALLLVFAAIVAMPCETFRVVLVNDRTIPIAARISVAEREIWSGTVDPKAEKQISFASPIGSDTFVAHIKNLSGDDQAWSQDVMTFAQYPYEIMPFVFVATPQGVNADWYRPHPYLESLESPNLRFVVFLGMMAHRGLQCLDCWIVDCGRS